MAGTIVGWNDTPSSDEFYVVLDEDIGKGAYLEYGKGDETVMARIAEVFRSNEYFENPESVSESMRKGESIRDRFPVDDWEVSIAKAVVMGKFSQGMIKRVSQAPSPGQEVEKADSDRVKRFLGLVEGGLVIGTVQQQGLDASLDMTDTLQKHFAVLAQSGAGKSYSASVILEELLDRENAPAVVAVDPHGDYTSFAEDENYMSRTRVYGDSDLGIAVNKLSAEQVAMFFNGEMSGPQREELREVFSELNRSENTDFGLEDVISRIKAKEMNSSVKYALMRKLRKLDSMDIFGKTDSPAPVDIEPGRLNIIDLNDVINNQKKQIIAAYFGRRFFRLRRRGSIPPFLYLVEEAHNFAPGEAPAPSRPVMEKIAREGRKFNCSLGLISQRPVRLSTTALSQCNTQFILRVTNPNDLEHIAQSSEGITSDVKNQIPGLKTGEAIVIGEAVNYPTFVDVRERRSKEAESSDALEEALEDWEEEQERKDSDAEAFM